MVPFGDQASDPASIRPRAWERVYWTRLDRPEQWALDPSEWASNPSTNKLSCKKQKNKPQVYIIVSVYGDFCGQILYIGTEIAHDAKCNAKNTSYSARDLPNTPAYNRGYINATRIENYNACL